MYVFDPTKNVSINLLTASKITTNVSSYTVKTIDGEEYEISQSEEVRRITNFLDYRNHKKERMEACAIALQLLYV